MSTFSYIIGGAIQNARKYELLNGATIIAEQNVAQPMIIYGAIDDNGYPGEIRTPARTGTDYPLAPVTKLTENGNIYYIRVTGNFDVQEENYASASIPFSGIFTLDSSDNVAVRYNDDTDDSAITVVRNDDGTVSFCFGVTIIKSNGDRERKIVEVFKITPTSNILGASLVSDSVAFYSADKTCVRTSFIPISALTSMDTDDVVAGPFPSGGDTCPYTMTFYSGLSHSSKVRTYTYDQVKDNFAVGGYLKFDAMKNLADSIPSAKYVIFNSYKPNSDTERIVSVGGIYFPLFEMTDKFTPGTTYNLQVKAIADGIFFANSEPSEQKEYTHPTLS